MTLADTKALAERFRGVADDKVAKDKLAEDTKVANSTDEALRGLCERYKAAADGAAVRVISDEVKARTV